MSIGIIILLINIAFQVKNITHNVTLYFCLIVLTLLFNRRFVNNVARSVHKLSDVK